MTQDEARAEVLKRWRALPAAKRVGYRDALAFGEHLGSERPLTHPVLRDRNGYSSLKVRARPKRFSAELGFALFLVMVIVVAVAALVLVT